MINPNMPNNSGIEVGESVSLSELRRHMKKRRAEGFDLPTGLINLWLTDKMLGYVARAFPAMKPAKITVTDRRSRND
jgi:hypothetical protein